MEAESSCTTNTSTTATTTYIPLPAAVLYRSLTEPFLDAPRRLQPQFDSHTHQKSFSTDASSSAQKPASTKSQRLEKTRRGHSTSNIPTVSPRQQQKNHASPKSLAAITLSLNSDPYSEATVSDICSPESELSTSTTRSLSPRKNHSNPSNSESRSKRPPASHSSYGIETSTGPPPSFSTQRTLSQDRMWKPPTPESSDASPTLKQGFFTGDMSASQAHGSGASPKHKAATDREDFETPDAAELDREPLSRTEEYNTPKSADGSATEDNNIPSSGEDQQSGKSEDIFLQIVKSEAGRSDISPHSERRTQPTLSSSYDLHKHSESQSDKFSPSPRKSAFPSLDVLPSARTDASRNTSKRSSLTYRPSASAHPRDDVSRTRHLAPSRSTASSSIGRDAPDTLSGIPQVSSRRFSNVDRSYRPSHVPLPRPTRLSAGGEADRQRFEGTESTVSTAVSNCFDDLHDIKSRLNRLEQARKLPPSSAAAMSNERPRTATTTITTMSSSPKHRTKKIESPVQTSIGGVPSTVHPLLHEALAKAKPVVNAEIYQRLEATAADALQLASMLGAGGSSGASTIGATSSIERQLRRRGDSMCRGLTELAIALSSEPAIPPPQAVRPTSKDVNSPEDTQSTIARVQSRLESRRRSLMAGSTLSESSSLPSPETAINSSQIRPSSSRLNRSSLLKYRREDDQIDGPEDDDRSPSLRPASRAMTELGVSTLVSRTSPRDRTFSREYTSQYPLPSRDRRDDTTTHASNIPSRRVYPSPAPAVTDPNNSSPLTPSFQSRSGLRRYGGSIGRASTLDSSVDNTPDSGGSRLSKPQRRSLGFGSQLSGLGSSVRSRLRAARTERLPTGQGQQNPGDNDVGVTALPIANHRAVHA